METAADIVAAVFCGIAGIGFVGLAVACVRVWDRFFGDDDEESDCARD